MTAFREEYVQGHKEKFPSLEAPAKPVPEKPWQDFMEEFVFESVPRGESVVEKFLDTHKNLSRTDRNLLRSWLSVVRGFFRVASTGGGTEAFCLVNEVAYPLVSEGFFPEGAYFVGRFFRYGLLALSAAGLSLTTWDIVIIQAVLVLLAGLKVMQSVFRRRRCSASPGAEDAGLARVDGNS